MSWAEIKKAVNSDLSIPLNEQLNSKPNISLDNYGYAQNPKFLNLSSIAGTTSPTEQTVVNVQGKGLFYGYTVMCTFKRGQAEWIKILIDGNAVLDINGTYPSNAGSDPSTTIKVFIPNDPLSMSSNMYYNLGDTINATTTADKLFSSYFYIVMPKPLFFKNSLQIVTKIVRSTNQTNAVFYDLFD